MSTMKKMRMTLRSTGIMLLVMICAMASFAASASQIRNLEDDSAACQEALENNPKEGRLFAFDLGMLNGVEGQIGTVVIRTRPSWAPIGVERFHDLVDDGFFDGCRFFRVIPNFVVQFGINGDPKVQEEWKNKGALKDDPVNESNVRGTITFATSGPDTRTTQMFINTKGNQFLDGQGFSPVGEVVCGMEYVDQINSEYRENPNQSMIQREGNDYLEKFFPRLSFISEAKGMSVENQQQ